MRIVDQGRRREEEEESLYRSEEGMLSRWSVKAAVLLEVLSDLW
jgi:hypothetical protein